MKVALSIAGTIVLGFGYLLGFARTYHQEFVGGYVGATAETTLGVIGGLCLAMAILGNRNGRR